MELASLVGGGGEGIDSLLSGFSNSELVFICFIDLFFGARLHLLLLQANKISRLTFVLSSTRPATTGCAVLLRWLRPENRSTEESAIIIELSNRIDALARCGMRVWTYWPLSSFNILSLHAKLL